MVTFLVTPVNSSSNFLYSLHSLHTLHSFTGMFYAIVNFSFFLSASNTTFRTPPPPSSLLNPLPSPTQLTKTVYQGHGFYILIREYIQYSEIQLTQHALLRIKKFLYSLIRKNKLNIVFFLFSLLKTYLPLFSLLYIHSPFSIHVLNNFLYTCTK